MNILKSLKIGLLPIIRNKITLFWNTIFPIFLTTIMILALGNINRDFKKIDVGMKNTNPYYEVAKNFPHINIKNAGEDILKELEDKKYIAFVNDDLSIDIVSNSYNVMIVKNTFESLKQISETKIDKREILENYNKNFVDVSNQEQDMVNIVVFSILIMTSMYTAFSTVEFTNNILLGEDNVAIRLLTSPLKKYQYLATGFIESIIVGMLNISILILYLKFILKSNVITNYPMTYFILFLTMLFSSVIGIFISTYVKGNSGLKSSIILGIIMLMSQLSGMYGTDMTVIINNFAPLIPKLNPGQYLTNSLIAVNKVTNQDNLKIGIIYILILTFVLFLLSVLKLRRTDNDF